MHQPSFTAVCLTYARPERLAEAVECFLRQDYQGPKELLVFNTFPKQQLVLEHPSIRVVNCGERPENLGAARNAAINLASMDWIVTWDDDDIYLPWHLSNFASAITPERQWVWMDKAFGASRFRITHLRSGTSNTFAFRKSLWEAAGKYPGRSGDEDALFVTKAANAGPGARFSVGDERASFIYSWNNGVSHISRAINNHISPVAYQTSEVQALRRLASGVLHEGKIVLAPKWERDWAGLAQEYVRSQRRPVNGRASKPPICIVQLGRYGDIINILPVAQRMAERYEVPALMVASEFANILEGVSYVKPHVVSVRYSQLHDAIRIAKREYQRVMVAQIYGTNYRVDTQCESFSQESWRSCGMLHEYGNAALRPLFDRRIFNREALLFRLLPDNGKPNILVNFRSATSAPVPQGSCLQARVFDALSHSLNLIDIADVRSERIFDMIGIMERADGLVSIDTGLVHLAGATSIPVIPIVNEGWTGSIPRANLASHFRTPAVIKDPGPLIEAIAKLPSCAKGSIKPTPLAFAPARRIFHCVERHNPNDQRRLRAQASWSGLYEAGVVPMHLWDYPRNAHDEIGDPRCLPYLKDVLAPAVEKANDEDIIFLTNDDNMLHPDLPGELRYHIAMYDAACSFRCEWRNAPRLNDARSNWVLKSTEHIGRDLFAFTKRWLVEHWAEIPDFILGASEWDLCLAAMMRISHGMENTKANIIREVFPSEMPKGCVGHESHRAFWAQPSNADTAPSQRHNRSLFRTWAREKRTVFEFAPEGQCVI